MSVISLASAQSAYRGYEYYEAKKVLYVEKRGDGILTGKVAGSGDAFYDTTVDINHPRKGSSCTCPFATGKQRVCKHMVAMYFTAFPEEAEKFAEDLRHYYEQEEQREREEQELEFTVVQYVKKMSKSELEAVLLALLLEGPDWQYEQFINEYIMMDEEDERDEDY